ncbi:MAG: RHS repeat-associated core domain-containing protein [Verrucomicrobiota bacterium]
MNTIPSRSGLWLCWLLVITGSRAFGIPDGHCQLESISMIGESEGQLDASVVIGVDEDLLPAAELTANGLHPDCPVYWQIGSMIDGELVWSDVDGGHLFTYVFYTESAGVYHFRARSSGDDGWSNVEVFTLNPDPDSDQDGLADSWEYYYFGNLRYNGRRDNDRDLVSNLDEFLLGTDPTSAVDGDFDDLPDDWEILNFGNLSESGEGDFDGDSVTNRIEFEQGTNPNDNSDIDLDGIPDDWELANDLVVGEDNRLIDTDEDGLNDDQEYLSGTDPNNTDTDSDGLSDGDEVSLGTDPHDIDSDGDGLFDGSEVNLFGTDPLEKHSDTDGFNDRIEIVIHGTDPNDPESRPLAWGPFTPPENENPPTAQSEVIYYGPSTAWGTDYRFGKANQVSLPRVEVGKGWAISSSEFLPDFNEQSKVLYFKRLWSTPPHDQVFVYTTSSSGAELGRVGRGWITGPQTIQADFSVPSQEVFVGTHTALVDDHIFKLNTSSAKSAGKGWVTGPKEMRPDYFEAPRAVYYGLTVPGDSSFSYGNQLIASTVDAGYGWIEGVDRVSPDYSQNPYNIYEVRLLPTLINEVSLSRGVGLMAQFRGVGWITSHSEFDPANVFSSDPEAVWAAQNDLDFYNENRINTPKGRNGDIDGDGFSNYEEFLAGTNPRDPTTSPIKNTGDIYEFLDSDRDGLTDLVEISIGSDPNNFDTDGDLLPDGFEYNSIYLDPLVFNDIEEDHDGDGLDALEELIHGTDPDLEDTDGDGISDGAEVLAGANPNDPGSVPFNPEDFYGPPLDDADMEPIGRLDFLGGGAKVGVKNVLGGMGDHSGSESERWRLNFNNSKSVRNRTFGEVEDFGLVLPTDRIWEVSISHVSTNGEGDGFPDYDYSLVFDQTSGFLLCDPDGMQGEFEMDDQPDEYWVDKRTYLVPITSASSGFSQSFSGSDAVGPRYRKVYLNGRPAPDEKPEQEDETESYQEETYVDAFDLSLRHDTSYAYVPLAASDLVLEANASVRETGWSNRNGLRPIESLTLPFGVGWTSNLCAYIEITETLEDFTSDPISVTVVDEGGRSQRFGTANQQEFFPWPSSRVDKKTWLNQLVREGDDLVLIKKFGTKLTYRPCDAWFMYSSDRIAGGALRRSTYWRLEEVEDRYGNRILYDYGSSRVSLIPELIEAVDRDDQWLVIVRSEDGRRVESITDARGETTEFIYSVNQVSAPGDGGLISSDGIIYDYGTLDAVQFSDGTERSYGYEVAVDEEVGSDGKITWHYHANLSSVTDKRGNTYNFEYGFDRTKAYWVESSQIGIGTFRIGVSSGEFNELPGDVQSCVISQLQEMNGFGDSSFEGEFRDQYGLPRQVRSVVLPGEEGTSTFAKTPESETIFGPEFSASSGTVVTDTLGNETRYRFEGIHGEIVDVDTKGSFGVVPVSTDWMIYYTTMTIEHSDVGSETFVFDLPSGLALSSMTDLSGNTTTWSFEDAIPPETEVPVIESEPTFMTRWSDPTSKTDALGRVETYQYGPWRVMSRVEDVHGTVTQWDVDEMGRRKDMTILDESGTKLLEERYVFDTTAGFEGFMREKRVVAFANVSGQSWEQDLVTEYEPDSRGRLWKEIVDPGGLSLTTEYNYDLNNNRTSILDPRDNLTVFTYDSLNRLVKTSYPAAGTSSDVGITHVRRLYDARGNLACVVDEEGRYTLYHHDALNRRTGVIQDMDGFGLPNLPAETAPQILLEDNRGSYTPADIRTQLAYNAVSSLSRVTDPRGIVTRHEYDDLQRVEATYVNWDNPSASSSEKTHTEFFYELQYNPGASAFASEGFKPTRIVRHDAVLSTSGLLTLESHHRYDADYRKVYGSSEYSPGNFATTITDYGTIDSFGKESLVSTVTDPRSKVTRSERDGLGRVIKVTDAFGTADAITTHTDFSSTGLAWRVTDPRGGYTETEYDGAARPVKVWQSDPVTGQINRQPAGDGLIGSPVTETIYDAAGNVEATINPRGQRWDFTYDARNRPVQEFAPEVVDASHPNNASSRPLTQTYYDGVGNVIRTVDPRFLSTVTEYDFADRPFEVEVSSVPVFGLVGDQTLTSSTLYDKNGNITSVTDFAGNRTTNSYDDLNRLVATATNPVNGQPSPNSANPLPGDIVVRYEYDDSGNQTLVTDGEGAQTAFRYDGLARNTRTIWDFGSQLQRTKTNTYDAVVMTGRTDEKDQVTQYLYDHLHRLEQVLYTGRSQDNRTYGYDENGNIETVSYPEDPFDVRAVVNDYDYLNRITSETSAGVSHGYTYDKAGNLRTTTYGLTTRQIVSTYDALNRLDTMTEGGRVTGYHYDLAGNIVQKDLANGVIVECTYDLLGRKKTSTNIASGASNPFASYTYDHDAAGNLARIVEAYPEGNLAYREVTNAYDRTYRLDTETILSEGTTKVTDYDYDDGNNRTRKGVTVGSAPEEVTNYQYGDGSVASGGNSNQLVSFTERSNTITFTYDANGNRATRTEGSETDTYTYDYENRLVSLNYQTGDSDTGLYKYAYDHRTRRVVRDESAVAGRDLHLLSFSHGLSVQEHIDTVSATPDAEYIRGSDYGGGIGGLLYSLRSGTPSFKHYNSRGDVVAATDTSGVLTYQAAYEAFGKHGDTPTSEEWGTNPDPQQANTKDEDPTGLLNEGFRYRDLETGSFITRDPLGFVDGPNVYTYVVQNPWTKFDPFGLDDWVIGIHSSTTAEGSLEYEGHTWNSAYSVQKGSAASMTTIHAFPDGDASNAQRWNEVATNVEDGQFRTDRIFQDPQRQLPESSRYTIVSQEKWDEIRSFVETDPFVYNQETVTIAGTDAPMPNCTTSARDIWELASGEKIDTEPGFPVSLITPSIDTPGVAADSIDKLESKDPTDHLSPDNAFNRIGTDKIKSAVSDFVESTIDFVSSIFDPSENSE